MTQDLKTQDVVLSYIDPAWDYLPILLDFLQLQHDAANAVTFIMDQKNATLLSHAQIAMCSEKMSNILQSVQQKLR